MLAMLPVWLLRILVWWRFRRRALPRVVCNGGVYVEACPYVLVFVGTVPEVTFCEIDRKWRR